MIAYFVIVLILLGIYYVYFKRELDFWKNKNVVSSRAIPFFGNYTGYILLKKCIHEVIEDLCRAFPSEPYIGAFYGTEPTLIVKDPEYIKRILSKDFYYFNSREVADYSEKEAITKTLFFTHGDRWKVLRQNLTPLFSSAKMKKMFHLIEDCNNSLNALLEDVAKKTEFEVRSLMARYTIDCIGSCAFGVNTEAMTSENNPFCVIGERIFDASNSRGFKMVGRAIWPAVFYKLGLNLFPLELTEFFKNMITKVFEERQYRSSDRHDFVDLVLNLRQSKHLVGDSMKNLKGDGKKSVIEVDDDLLSAQCMLFFAAGFETSATTLGFLLYELAKNPEKQEQAMKEVDEYFKNNKKISYECVFETPYLDACINETLRLYPVLGVLTREVVEDYTLGGVSLERGVRIHIPVLNLHKNPHYFPNPEAFRPERFLGVEKDKIKPFTYFPFGEGPRICIGMRFAKMQMTAGLLTILKKCQIQLVENTARNITFEPRAMTLQPAHGINLKLVLRKK
ncbi:unnamed protein product [Leptosia nina]|uniref:unspecific monooxygenase n=1 Tax=Leptosia nina TaxID=320188 RepID=A0AAV1IYT9_9NEOP